MCSSPRVHASDASAALLGSKGINERPPPLRQIDSLASGFGVVTVEFCFSPQENEYLVTRLREPAVRWSRKVPAHTSCPQTSVRVQAGEGAAGEERKEVKAREIKRS